MYIPLARVELHTNTHIASAKLYTCLGIRAFMMADSFMYQNNRALSSTSSGICIAIDVEMSHLARHSTDKDHSQHHGSPIMPDREPQATGSHPKSRFDSRAMQCQSCVDLTCTKCLSSKAQLWLHLCLAPSFFVYTHIGCRQCRLFQWLSLETM
jgi:hypothetical protein